MTFTCSALLFDLDGTLVDSIVAVDRSWSRWAARNGFEPSEVLPHIHGRRAIDSVRLLAPHLDAESEVAWMCGIESQDTEGIVEVPGSLAFISKVPAGRWSIVTSGTSDVAIARMGAVGIKPVTAIYGEDVANGKPAPDPYLAAAQRLGVPPSECLVFEDTRAGVDAGHAAGMKVIAITSGAVRPDLAHADLVVSDYTWLEVTVQRECLVVSYQEPTR